MGKNKSELEKYGRLLIKTFNLDSELCSIIIDGIDRAKTDMEIDLLIRSIKNKLSKETRNFVINFAKQVYEELKK